MISRIFIIRVIFLDIIQAIQASRPLQSPRHLVRSLKRKISLIGIVHLDIGLRNHQITPLVQIHIFLKPCISLRPIEDITTHILKLHRFVVDTRAEHTDIQIHIIPVIPINLLCLAVHHHLVVICGESGILIPFPRNHQSEIWSLDIIVLSDPIEGIGIERHITGISVIILCYSLAILNKLFLYFCIEGKFTCI